MERQRRGARLDEPRAELEARARAVLDAASHLHGHRHRRRSRPRRRSGTRAPDPPAGARRRPSSSPCARGSRSSCRRCPRRRPRPSAPPRPSRPAPSRRSGSRADARPRRPAGSRACARSGLDPGAGDHLRADEPGAEAASLAAERLDADARHRREHDPRRHLDVADPPRLPEIHLHRADGIRRLLTTVRAGGTIRPRRAAVLPAARFAA